MIEAIVGTVEGGGVTRFVPTDAVVVQLFLELAELFLVAVVDEEGCLPKFDGGLRGLLLAVSIDNLVKICVVEIVGDNVEHCVSTQLSPHVLDDVGLVFEFETVGVIGLSVGLCHVHEPLLGLDE